MAALIAIVVLQQAHSDLHEHLELPVALHLLRDGALAVPAAGLALLAATLAFGADAGTGRAGRATAPCCGRSRPRPCSRC